MCVRVCGHVCLCVLQGWGWLVEKGRCIMDMYMGYVGVHVHAPKQTYQKGILHLHVYGEIEHRSILIIFSLARTRLVHSITKK